MKVLGARIEPTVTIGVSGGRDDPLRGKLIVPPSLYAAIKAEGFCMDGFVIQVPPGTFGRVQGK